MKRRIISVFAIIMLFAGLSLLLYPTVSDYINRVKHRRAIFNYLGAVEEIDDDEYVRILNRAIAYNDKLAKNQPGLMALSDEEMEEYLSVLDVTGTGIMGYIQIDKADISLPIYHTSTDAVLQTGVGHIEGTSLPIGGESVHSMLSGHRGLPSAKLFTDIDKLKIGDRFTLHVLDEYYTYEVDKIDVVEPQEIQDVRIEQGQDRSTLMTCTPYGVNTHRLLIHGKRVPIPIEEEKMAIQSGARIVNMLYVLAAVEVPTLVIAVVVSTKCRRHKLKTKYQKSRGEI